MQDCLDKTCLKSIENLGGSGWIVCESRPLFVVSETLREQEKKKKVEDFELRGAPGNVAAGRQRAARRCSAATSSTPPSSSARPPKRPGQGSPWAARSSSTCPSSSGCSEGTAGLTCWGDEAGGC